MAKEEGFANFTPKQAQAFIKEEKTKHAHTGLERYRARQQQQNSK